MHNITDNMDIAFVAYFIAVISLGVSLYALYLVSELRNESPKPKIRKQSKPPIKVQRPKGHWD